MKLTATVLKLSLDEKQSAQVNDRGWGGTMFGQAYLDLSMLRGTLKTSDLYTALDLGLYRPAKIFSLDAPASRPGECSTEDLMAAGDMIFSRDNNPTARDAGVKLIRHSGMPTPSLSVGDIIAFGVLPEDKPYLLICASMGWQMLSKVQEDLVRLKTHDARRDLMLSDRQAA